MKIGPNLKIVLYVMASLAVVCGIALCFAPAWPSDVTTEDNQDNQCVRCDTVEDRESEGSAIGTIGDEPDVTSEKLDDHAMVFHIDKLDPGESTTLTVNVLVPEAGWPEGDVCPYCGAKVEGGGMYHYIRYRTEGGTSWQSCASEFARALSRMTKGEWVEAKP